MLARTRIRRFAVGALKDCDQPHGPDCSCVGPIAQTCDGDDIPILDSPTGFIGDRLSEYGSGDIGLPVIAVYVEDDGAGFSANQGEAKIDLRLSLLVEIYVTGESDWQAEDALDELHERVLFRLFRSDGVDFDGLLYQPIIQMQPESLRTRTERELGDRRVFMRTLEISLRQCEDYSEPVCIDPDEPTLCVGLDVTPA